MIDTSKNCGYCQKVKRLWGVGRSVKYGNEEVLQSMIVSTIGTWYVMCVETLES